MYYKDDLLAKDFAELVDIANELGADAKAWSTIFWRNRLRQKQ